MKTYLSAIVILALAAAAFGQAVAPASASTAKAPTPPASAAASPATSTPALGGKLSVPDGAALKNAQKLVNDVYKDDLAKAKSPEQKQALAKAMLATAGDEKQPAGRFVLLTMATELAGGAGDMENASAAIDRLEGAFAVDALKLRSDAAAAAGRSARTAEQCRKVVVLADAIIDSAVSADRYDMARMVSDAALTAAHGANDAGLLKGASTRMQEVHEAEGAFVAAKNALAAFGSKPTDPEANLTIGKYRGFIKGDWEAGLPMLARAGDETIKALAALEQAGVKSADDQVKLADGWWNVSEKFTGQCQRHLQQHAGKWYHTALPALTGLVKLRVQKRLETLESEATAAQPAGHRTIDLMALVDTGKDAVGGSWLVKDKTLRSDDSGSSRIEFPYHPPGEYDFHIEFMREQGDDSVNMIVAAGGKHFMWTMGGWKNTVLGFDEIGHVRANQNPKSISVKTVLENGKRYEAIVKVRQAGVEAYVNSKLVGQWKTDYADMGIPDHWDLRDGGAVGVATNKSVTVFYKIEVTEVTGAGTLTRK